MGVTQGLFNSATQELLQKTHPVFALHWSTFSDIVAEDSVFSTIEQKQTELLLYRYKKSLYSM
jgi:hypothetical protein